MTTRKINRLIIKKDGKVYSFRCLAASGAITLRDSDFVYIAFVADLLTNSETDSKTNHTLHNITLVCISRC